VPVREIERLTGLDFGTLREHDTFAPDGSESHTAQRPLRKFRDLDIAPRYETAESSKASNGHRGKGKKGRR
jgi:hypothetical protein